MDSLLEFLVLGVRGSLLLCPIVVSALDRRHPRPATDDIYSHHGAPERAGTWVPFSGNRVRWTGGEIPSILVRS
jgi:hypothetical protein